MEYRIANVKLWMSCKQVYEEVVGKWICRKFYLLNSADAVGMQDASVHIDVEGHTRLVQPITTKRDWATPV